MAETLCLCFQQAPAVEDIGACIRFYSKLFNTVPAAERDGCCNGALPELAQAHGSSVPLQVKMHYPVG